MKGIIKIICVALCAAMAISLGAGCSTRGNTGDLPIDTEPTVVTTTSNATEPTAPDVTTGNTEPDDPYIPPEFESELVAYFDFEGDSALADKSGKTDATLTLHGNASVSGGILTVPDGAGTYASIPCVEGSALYDLKNTTVIIKAKIDNDTSQSSTLVSAMFSKESAYDVYFSSVANGRVSQFRFRDTASVPTYISESKTPTDEWRVYAITAEYSEQKGKLTLTLYKSKTEKPQSESDFERVHTFVSWTAKSETIAGGDAIYLGKRYDHLDSARTLVSKFSEIKVYSRALSLSEIAEIDMRDIDRAVRSELGALIKTADTMEQGVHTDAEWRTFRGALDSAKKLTEKSSFDEIKASYKLLKAQIELMDFSYVASSIGSLTMIPYNNPELDVPVATGLHNYPALYDIDGDGDLDLISIGISRSYGGNTGGGVYLHRNLSGKNGATHFGSAEFLQTSVGRIYFSTKLDGTPVFVDENGKMYEKLTYSGFEDGRIAGDLERSYKLYDINGDGRSDAVFPANKFSEDLYYTGGVYDENGNSLQTAESGLTWVKNTGSDVYPIFNTSRHRVLNSKGKEFCVSDEGQYTYFRSFCMFDWDGDGDLDLIAGGWQNEFYYYENKGNKTTPVFDADGVRIETEAGALALDVCCYNIIDYDWNGDGRDDLLIGTESGTVIYLTFKGFNAKTGAPIFTDNGYFMKDADYLWVNALSRPTACDFDADGDTDLIVGDNCGFFWFYENLTGGENPSWAAPVKMCDEKGNVLVIKGGYNGSFQGTRESEWGYTVPVACDWDNDGDFDIVANSVTGRIVWLENIGTREKGQLTRPTAVEVEWTNGNKYPEWLWWKPAGNELVTQHRTTPFATDFNADGLCDIIMLDHEGYLAFFERYKENGGLKLKPGERIFYLDGAPLRLTDKIHGQSGRIKFVVTDWDCDGLLDVIVGVKTMVLYKTVKVENGKYHLQNLGELSIGSIAGHNHGFTVVDFNFDGKPDLLSGSESGYFYYLENK